MDITIDWGAVIMWLAAGGIGIIIFFLLRLIYKLDEIGLIAAQLKIDVALIKKDIKFHNEQTDKRLDSGMQRIVDNERDIKKILVKNQAS